MKRKSFSGQACPYPESKEEKVDYHSLRFGRQEGLRVLGEGLAAAAFLTVFFYRSLFAFLLLLAGLPWYIKKRRAEMAKERRQRLAREFKELLSCVEAQLQSGASAETAFCACAEEMEALFGPESCIVRELGLLQKGLGNRQPLESLLQDLGSRSGIEEIEEFAGIFALAKRTGGSMQKILGRTIRLVAQRLEVKREIRGYLGARRMEQKIMNLVPFAILAYVEVTSPGYFSIFYHNITGNIIMSICLIVYAAAYHYAEKLVEVEV